VNQYKLDSLTKKNLEVFKTNNKIEEENKKLSQALKDKNAKLEETHKKLLLLKAKIRKTKIRNK